jgi:hypothetical protein
MNPDQLQRLLAETRDTADRLNKLNAFLGGDQFPVLPREDKDLLYSQQRAMSRYVQILGQRLERQGFIFSHREQASNKPLTADQWAINYAISEIKAALQCFGDDDDKAMKILSKCYEKLRGIWDSVR